MKNPVPRVGPIERFLRYLGGSPVTARASRLILDDSTGKGIGEPLGPSTQRNREQRAELAERFASGDRHYRCILATRFVERFLNDRLRFRLNLLQVLGVP